MPRQRRCRGRRTRKGGHGHARSMRNHVLEVAAMDLFVVLTIGFARCAHRTESACGIRDRRTAGLAGDCHVATSAFHQL